MQLFSMLCSSSKHVGSNLSKVDNCSYITNCTKTLPPVLHLLDYNTAS